jgi:hypothetical protein
VQAGALTVQGFGGLRYQKKGGAKGRLLHQGDWGQGLRNYLILIEAREPEVLPVPAISFSK